MKISKKALGMPPEGFVFAMNLAFAALNDAHVADRQRCGAKM
ncbi:hypothetical protein [Bradyrhizobium sp. NBAIM01]|nr:hypothetical protein [Bradyrhizobium sp. NBAIM01]